MKFLSIVKGTLDMLHSPGGQMLMLYVLFYSTYIPQVFHLADTDLSKQSFAAILGFITGHAAAVSKSREGVPVDAKAAHA